MNVLGLVPARGGSKSIPHKSIAPVAGKPLLLYTAEAALGSKRLGRTILSTDDEAIARVGRAAGLEVPFRRPPELAGDETPMVDVVRHALGWLDVEAGWRADVVVLLQPTSPLRRAEHVDGAVDLLCETGAETVVSVCEVPHQFTPVSLMRVEEGRLVPFLSGPLILRRQDKPRVYARNGPAVLAVRREVVLERRSLYGVDVRPYPMAGEDSLDVDTPLDLELAAFLLGRREPR